MLRTTYFFYLNDWTYCSLNCKFWRRVACHGNNFISILLHNYCVKIVSIMWLIS